MVMKHNSRGSITRAFNQFKRLREDKEYKEKQLKRKRDWNKRNRERSRERGRNFTKQLNEFVNKRCEVCFKLLFFKNKSGLCKEHFNKEGGAKGYLRRKKWDEKR